MNKISISYNGHSRQIGFSAQLTSPAELQQLVRLEFGLDSAVELALSTADGVLIPFNPNILSSNNDYNLRVYGVASASFMPPHLPPPPQQDSAANANSSSLAASLLNRPSAMLPAEVYEGASEAARHAASVILGGMGGEAAPSGDNQQRQSESQADANAANDESQQQEQKQQQQQQIGPTHPAMSDPDASNWMRYNTDEGQAYYYHRKTGFSTWDKPDCMKTEQEKDPNFANQKYYEDEGYDPFEDEQYFDSYTDLSLQGEMVGDKSRSDSYRNAFLRFGAEDFKDKVVLDVGAGTGLLSYFAVQAGAKKVYAIEASSLATTTMEGVEKNGLSNKIIVYHARVEDIELPEKVDVIVSEWMGAGLIFESMLGSVLFARDKWLKEKGILYPSRSTIYFAPIEAEKYFKSKVDFWTDKETLYGIDMSVMLPSARRCCTEKPMFDRLVEATDVLADETTVVDYDLMTMTVDEMELLRSEFAFKVNRDAKLHGFAIWFDVTFESRRLYEKSVKNAGTVDLSDKENGPVLLSTSPACTPTHWKQLSLLLDAGIALNEGDVITGTMVMQRNTYWRRHFNFDVDYEVVTKESAESEAKKSSSGSEESDGLVVKASGSKTFGLWRYKTDNAPTAVPKNAL